MTRSALAFTTACVLTLSGVASGKIARRLVFSTAAAGGPRVQLEFDAPLLKEIKQAR